MINCLVVDDEEHAIEVLTHHISQCAALSLITSTTDPHEALNIIAEGKIDLLFLDVHMPQISGIEVAKLVAGKCRIILTTAYPEYALDGYDVGVDDFLLKPVSYARFLKAVQKASESIAAKKSKGGENVEPESDYIYIKTGIKNNVLRIDISEIIYIESLQNYVSIHCNERKLLAYLSMREIESSLPIRKFIRVHKSFIVSLKNIIKIEGSEIELAGTEQRISIGDSYKSKFWEVIRKSTLG